MHLHLCMLIHDLTEKYGPVVREARVIGVLDAAFDVVVVSCRSSSWRSEANDTARIRH